MEALKQKALIVVDMLWWLSYLTSDTVLLLHNEDTEIIREVDKVLSLDTVEIWDSTRCIM